MEKGKLYLLPTTLGDFETIGRAIPEFNLEIIRSLDIFIVEQVRTARRFLVKCKHPIPIDQITFFELNKHTQTEQISSYLNEALQGKSIGLLSEAGTPCIADPGAVIVKMAQELGIKVVPLVGPNSIILALMASGFNGQHFVFHGYLPIDRNDLVKKIKEIETNARKLEQTQIFIETPYRNHQLFENLLKTCDTQTLLCIATDLTLETEKVKTLPINLWKKEKVDFHKKPTVFLLYF
ncbi:MAG TPA: SAM-dependent methyltransferase [Bacteroidales bacterium]